jgi:iron(III) transport system ATP-binding protein
VQLSGGQQQRVALARALATSPGCCCSDEPLSALDARVRLRLARRDQDAAAPPRRHHLMVTHDQEEALAMADCIVVMNQGVIEQVGSPHEFYRKPSTAFVADFVGTMTFLDRRDRRADVAARRSDRAGLSRRPRFKQRLAGAHRPAPEEIRVRNIDTRRRTRSPRKCRRSISSVRSAART